MSIDVGGSMPEVFWIEACNDLHHTFPEGCSVRYCGRGCTVVGHGSDASRAGSLPDVLLHYTDDSGIIREVAVPYHAALNSFERVGE